MNRVHDISKEKAVIKNVTAGHICGKQPRAEHQ
jgi:hypothetical protein